MDLDDLKTRPGSERPRTVDPERNAFMVGPLGANLLGESTQQIEKLDGATRCIELIAGRAPGPRSAFVSHLCMAKPEQIRKMTAFARIGLNYSNIWQVDKSTGLAGFSMQSEFQGPQLLTALTACPNPAALKPCPFEAKMKEVVIKQLSPEWLAGMTADLDKRVTPNPRHLGRTLIYTVTDGTQYAVKLLKNNEKPEELDAEGKMQLTFAALKEQFGLKSDFPGCVGRGQFEVPPEHVQLITQANKVSLQAGEGQRASNGNCLVYQVKPNEGYFDYVNQIPIEAPEQRLAVTQEALCNAAHDIFACAAHGWMYTQLADLYHSKPKPGETRSTDGGRALMLVGAIRADDSSVAGMGSIKNIHAGTEYPNVRRSGLADVGDASSMQALAAPLCTIRCLAAAGVFGDRRKKDGSYDWELLARPQPLPQQAQAQPQAQPSASTSTSAATQQPASGGQQAPKRMDMLAQIRARQQAEPVEDVMPQAQVVQARPAPDFKQVLKSKAAVLRKSRQLLALFGPEFEHKNDEELAQCLIEATTESKSWEACAHMVDLCRLDEDIDLVNRMRAEILAEQMLCVMLLAVTSFLRDGATRQALTDCALRVIAEPQSDISGERVFSLLKEMLLNAFVSAVQGFCGARLKREQVLAIVTGLGDFERLTLQLTTFCTMSGETMDAVRALTGPRKDALMKRLYPTAAETIWTMDAGTDELSTRQMGYEGESMGGLPSHLGRPGTQMPIKEFEEIAFNLALFLLSSEMQPEQPQ